MRQKIDLSGKWRFALDPNEKGTNMCGGWYQSKLPDEVILPGSTSSNMVGIESKVEDKLGVIERYTYRGMAWYQRDIEIPAEWANKHIELKLERANNTTVWLDEIEVGHSDLMFVDQIYDLTHIATPGTHTLTIRNDNTRIRPTHTYRFDFLNQVNGELSLTATDRVFVRRTTILPKVNKKAAVIHFYLENQTGCECYGDMMITFREFATGKVVKTKRYEFRLEYNRSWKPFELEVYLGEDVKLWDEFEPNLYCMEIELYGRAGDQVVRDTYHTRFGMREFKADGTQFSINGKKLFLRGDALLHEKYMYRTGRSLYSKEDWLEVLKIYKEYGINYLRFHTHCPPNAVFEAADEMGIYMQPELTMGGTNGMNIPGPDSPLFDPLLEPTMQRWGTLLLDWLNNHPSFVMLTLGNEINGDRSLLERLVEYLRAHDKSRLYAQGSNNFIRNDSISVNDDFWSTMKVKPIWEDDGNVRGSYAHSDPSLGPVQDELPRGTMRDYSKAIEDIPIPVIAFELGQYETTCNFDEIERFPEMELPGSMLFYKKMMEEKGLLHKEKAFYKDSGQACLMCYREDIEMLMRTRGYGGFQILSLADIYTDGTALDGILNAFMENKGMVSAEEWARYCSPWSVLLRIEKFLFEAGEETDALIQFANYGPEGCGKLQPYWELNDAQGHLLERKVFEAVDLPQGELTDAAHIRIQLPAVKQPQQLVLRIGFENSRFLNEYKLWVYPAVEIQPAVVETGCFEEALEALKKGEKVLYYSPMMRSDRCVEGFFATNFWSYDMFRTAALNVWDTRPGLEPIGVPLPPGTMGISYDPAHPAFRYFPGQGHSDMPWFDIVMKGNPIILDRFEEEIEPVVWTIDTPHRCHRIGMMFEVKVGDGRLFVCSTDLRSVQTHAAQWLRKGIAEYMLTDAFAPKAACSESFARRFFCETEAL